jgi:hypothetical protein
VEEIFVGGLKVEHSVIFEDGHVQSVVVGIGGAYGRIISPMDDDMSYNIYVGLLYSLQ